MKRRFMVILLASGLVLGLCGCGSSSDSAAALTPPATENATVPEETEVAEEIVQEPEVNEGAGPADSGPVEPGVTEPDVEPESEAGYPTVNIDTSGVQTDVVTHVCMVTKKKSD